MKDQEAALQAARAALLARLGVSFADESLLRQALRHPSWTREKEEDPLTSNERLEFLGDAVVQLSVTEYLYLTAPGAMEGDLSARRAALVQGASLSAVGLRLELGDALKLGRSARGSGGRAVRAMLESGFEALIGAIYLDQGWEVARRCVWQALAEQIADPEGQVPQNYKGQLQERVQEQYGRGPRYETISTIGPAHEREFVVKVFVDGQSLGVGRGGSKKDAEQQAAAEALAKLLGDSPATSEA